MCPAFVVLVPLCGPDARPKSSGMMKYLMLMIVPLTLAACVEAQPSVSRSDAPLADRIAADCARRKGKSARDSAGNGLKAVRCHLPDGRIESWGIVQP